MILKTITCIAIGPVVLMPCVVCFFAIAHLVEQYDMPWTDILFWALMLWVAIALAYQIGALILGILFD